MFLHFLQTQEHKEAFLELAHVVANADGFVNRREKEYLRTYLSEMDMQPYKLQTIKARPLADIIGDLKDEPTKNIFFAEILLLIFADGDYNDEEKQIVRDMQKLFGFSDETYEVFKDWVIRVDQLKVEGMKLILNPPQHG
ncbi:tellurite resistance TerB family protein [Paenibacillus harenae]|uniref:Tellurite resistance protein n=1 Tax=Paenibacillus harenae TaxID=306543 RepID=A0ABT9TV67_PAEHA|nr:TerB family tellurite resistance protein [Paenibacillus harenae]MDQ0057911.1 tellurite resistance protein [Paenibacillus harenae]MDQ0111259.1 tellurite resistance protein [Paenibacillus harenae]